MSSERERTAGAGAVGVDELMGRVRQEVERRRLDGRLGADVSPGRPSTDATPWLELAEAIGAAESVTTVGMRLPPMHQLRGWKRRLAVPLARLILRAAQLVTRDQSAYNALILELVRTLARTAHTELDATTVRMETLTNGLAQALAQTRAIPDLVDAGARTGTEVRALREMLGGIEDALARLETAVASGRDEARASGQALQADAERFQSESRRAIASLERRLAGPGPVPGGAAPTTAAVPAAGPGLPDAFYVSFEDRFRGARDDVKSRGLVYLPVLAEAGVGAADRPVLDLGCGRGEWLELLGEHGLVGRGVDLNATMVAESRARGLDVVEGSALEHLRGLPDASLGAVTGMHLLEHVDFGSVVAILDECVRVLRPGGLVVFETPNPQNLLVGACQFYIDPTHRRPLHPDTMAFVASSRGLARVRIMPLHPFDPAHRLDETDSPVARVVNQAFFGPQDYAVVGYRP